MHDYHKAVEVIEYGAKEAQKQGKTRVKKVFLSVGKSSGYSADTIRMYFEENKPGTACAEAELVIDEPEATLKCPKCGEVYPRKPLHLECPKCGAEGLPTDDASHVVIKGAELE